MIRWRLSDWASTLKDSSLTLEFADDDKKGCELSIRFKEIPATGMRLYELEEYLYRNLLIPLDEKLECNLKRCKRKRCEIEQANCEFGHYCEECKRRFISVLRIMSLVNGDANPIMSFHSFKVLFSEVLLPLFDPQHFERFCLNAQPAYEEWLRKFKIEHTKIQ